MSGSPKKLKTGAKLDYAKYDKARIYNGDQEASPQFKVLEESAQKTDDTLEKVALSKVRKVTNRNTTFSYLANNDFAKKRFPIDIYS